VYRPLCIGYIETAMAEYFRNLGIPTYHEEQWSYSETSIVKATIEFKSRARVDEVLRICLRVTKVEHVTLTLESEIYSDTTGDLVARAELTYESYEKIKDFNPPIPEHVKELISRYEGAPL
jgi:YbgC/YbaW family acyl-CoA thioester hydrolase